MLYTKLNIRVLLFSTLALVVTAEATQAQT